MTRHQNTSIVFDIETDGLLLEVSKFHVGWTYCLESKKYEKFLTANEMVMYLNEADTLVGHNIIGYDIPALNKLASLKIREDINIVDTLILSRLAYYDADFSFSHSLNAYGQRLGFPKGDHSDWTKYSPEMDEYCKRDVDVTVKVLQHLRRKTGQWLPDTALELEQAVQTIIVQQHLNGWLFDVKAAQTLHVELLDKMDNAERELHEVFKPIKSFVPKKYPTTAYKKDGTKSQALLRQEALGCDTFIIDGQPQWGYYEDLTFNPGSGQHIHKFIEHYFGKQRWEMTDKGTPRTDAKSLKKMFKDKEFATPLLHYQEVKKLLGQLAEGDNAWLKQVRDNNRIHGSANILGAVTGRFTHSNPNMAQVPSVKAFKGVESRSLFCVPKGYKLVGCDASGLELRTLSHYLAKHDGGEYGKKLIEEDIHTANQVAAGLPTRDNAKTFIYGFLYGAGDAKIGEIVKGSSADGKRLKQQFLSKTKGLDKLVKGVQQAAKRGYLIGVTGRRLFVRSPHAALNVLLQSAGAYIMKYYLVHVTGELQKAGVEFYHVGNIHDELQLQVKEEDVDKCVSILNNGWSVVEKRLNWRCQLDGEAKIGNNWADTH